MNLTDRWQRSTLRRAAHRYAEHGWAVVPGAFLAGDRFRCGQLCPTVGCHPALDNWSAAASVDPTDVDDWWRTAPFSVLLATGGAFDVIEVPARLGMPAVAARAVGPTVVSPTGRWMFLVRAGHALRPELAAQLDVVIHRAGSWIAAPPTRSPEGRVRWAVHPSVTGWAVPDPYAVQEQLLARAPVAPTFATSSTRLGRAA